MITMTRDEYIALAEKHWGKDNKNWLFECPHCHTYQGFHNFVEAGVEKAKIEDYLGFSCIGRFTDKLGCDWTLGGLFQIHEVEVDYEGKKYRRFKIAEPKEVSC